MSRALSRCEADRFLTGRLAQHRTARCRIDPPGPPALKRPVVGEYHDHRVSSCRFEVSNDSSYRSNTAIRGVASTADRQTLGDLNEAAGAAADGQPGNS